MSETELISEGVGLIKVVFDIFEKVVDNLIPWKTYEETIRQFDRYKNDYSNAAGALVGEIKALLLNAKDAYFTSSQEIYEWCGLAIPILHAYNNLLTNSDPVAISSRKNLIVQVLNQGITKMTAAQAKLDAASLAFNGASTKVIALRAQLKNDFSEAGAYYQSQVEKMRREAYGTAATGIFAGPFGLIITYSIAAGVVEGKLIPELQAKLEEVRNYFNTVDTLLVSSDADMAKSKETLKKEINVITDLKVSAEKTLTFAKLESAHADTIKQHTNELINKCINYQQTHK